MTGWTAIFRREFVAYFATPVALVFSIVFLSSAAAFTFYLGDFFVRDQADLQSFFYYHPWLFLFLIPAVSMRLWAEDRRAGTFEVLLTLPVSSFAVVFGKFMAAWTFIGLTLVLTFPIWLTVNYLGSPDNGAILASYSGSFLMAGAYLSIGTAMSALTRNQIVAFISTAAICFLFMVSGLSLVQAFFEGWLPDALMSLLASLSFLTRFSEIMKGVIKAQDLVFFMSLIGFWLFANYVFVNLKREAG